MIYLFDTCAFIWSYSETDKLSASVRDVLMDDSHDIVLSVVSPWEVVLKQAKRKFPLGDIRSMVAAVVDENDYRVLPIELDHVARLSVLPPIHADPYDRMLIAQALVLGATILTPDHKIRQYPVPTLW